MTQGRGESGARNPPCSRNRDRNAAGSSRRRGSRSGRRAGTSRLRLSHRALDRMLSPHRAVQADHRNRHRRATGASVRACIGARRSPHPQSCARAPAPRPCRVRDHSTKVPARCPRFRPPQEAVGEIPLPAPHGPALPKSNPNSGSRIHIPRLARVTAKGRQNAKVALVEEPQIVSLYRIAAESHAERVEYRVARGPSLARLPEIVTAYPLGIEHGIRPGPR